MLRLLPLALVAAGAVMTPVLALAGTSQVVQVPEPGTLGMFAAGVGAVVVAVRMWRR